MFSQNSSSLKHKLLVFLTRYQQLKNKEKNSGFTLIEVLVATILAAIIITPILGFMVGILQENRQEEVKANTDQELQAALEYIKRDLQQAVYIYDKASLATVTDGYKDTSQLYASSDMIPVLVFWKRKFIARSTPLNPSTDCTGSTDSLPPACQVDDGFAYSLVAYYLIKDNSDTWSETARIGRWEIQDGVRKTNGEYVNEAHETVGRDDGFKIFNLNESGDLDTKMGKWKKHHKESYNINPKSTVLIDYIDQSTSVPSEDCPTGFSQVPDYANANVDSKFETYSFYACVDDSNQTAKVVLRGNALARIPYSGSVPTYSSEKSIFFPRTSIQVTARGSLGE